MKKLLSIFAGLTLSVSLWAINNVPYIDADGELKYQNNVALVSNKSDTLKAGWYLVVPGTSDKQTGTIVCEGEVHFILADGAKLTATGDDETFTPGIQVSGEGNSLTIYGQTDQTGQLIANGGVGAAGIGGRSGESGSNITIYGGIIIANGGENASGIGNGFGAEDNASNILVATSLVVKADGNNPPTTVIAANRTATTDIASDLEGKQYVTIEKGSAPSNLVNVNVNANAIKYLYNGQVIIRNGQKMYNVTGAEL